MVGLRVIWNLDDDEMTIIESMGFVWLLYMPHNWVNHGLVTVLAERWHNEHNTFHLPIGEVTVILKDVYHILHVPCHGDPMSSVDMS